MVRELTIMLCDPVSDIVCFHTESQVTTYCLQGAILLKYEAEQRMKTTKTLSTQTESRTYRCNNDNVGRKLAPRKSEHDQYRRPCESREPVQTESSTISSTANDSSDEYYLPTRQLSHRNKTRRFGRQLTERDDQRVAQRFADRDDHCVAQRFTERDDQCVEHICAERDDKRGKQKLAERDDQRGKQKFAERDDQHDKQIFAERDVQHDKQIFAERDDQRVKQRFAERDDQRVKQTFARRDDKCVAQRFAQRDNQRVKHGFAERDDSRFDHRLAERGKSRFDHRLAERDESRFDHRLEERDDSGVEWRLVEREDTARYYDAEFEGKDQCIGIIESSYEQSWDDRTKENQAQGLDRQASHRIHTVSESALCDTSRMTGTRQPGSPRRLRGARNRTRGHTSRLPVPVNPT